MRSIIRFLNTKTIQPIEIYKEVFVVVSDEASSRKWCIMFNEGLTNVHHDERFGRPSLTTENFRQNLVG